MVMPETATVSSNDVEWTIVARNPTVSGLAPPAAPAEYTWAEPTYGMQPRLPLDWALDSPPSYQVIVERLLRDYADIWQALANR